MEGFTPVPALIGGLMIGAAAALLLWLNGRIAGVSGIAWGLIARPREDSGWRLAFLGGLVLGALLYRLASGDAVMPNIEASWAAVLLGGILVGFGTQLSGGCTSGHGVCGIARLSPRSAAATLTFMASAMITVFVARHVFGA
ncbi:MAG TPA: YeeE/YedE family protein [Candidatus Acidoferrales bacterium]|nr:YeeE/YedE family protein [Candidatus Acidoferrales bacterium]